MTEMPSYWQNYIDGAWVDGGAGRLAVVDPSTGEALAEVAQADAGDVDRAVEAARRVSLSGALTAMRPVERGRMVQAIGRWLLEHADEITAVLTAEQGKPIWEAKTEVTGAARYFEYYGNQAETVEGRSIPLGAGYVDYTVHEPYGVSAQIIPWNFPLEMVARSLSAGLATGNACVVKTPELTPLACTYVARAAEEAGFPPGAVNILCGLGAEAGAAL
ncbi:MAG: aldehyde dehydrogenase family protein, partial [Paracoccaceae bacterium]|nr:aldehyde dehydrogenase family protein [Paracoccaceae bacterium]